MAGKGDSPRKVDRKKWDACPLWRKDKPRKDGGKAVKEIKRLVGEQIPERPSMPDQECKGKRECKEAK